MLYCVAITNCSAIVGSFFSFAVTHSQHHGPRRLCNATVTMTNETVTRLRGYFDMELVSLNFDVPHLLGAKCPLRARGADMCCLAPSSIR
jgi:hypothetical protein